MKNLFKMIIVKKIIIIKKSKKLIFINYLMHTFNFILDFKNKTDIAKDLQDMMQKVILNLKKKMNKTKKQNK